MTRKLILVSFLTVFLIAFLCLGAFANYPEKTIEIIAAYSAGGSVDSLARLVGEGLEKELGWNAVVINKPGAGGEIGYTYIAEAKPDGYTIGVISLPGALSVPYSRKESCRYSADSFTKIANIVLDNSLIAVGIDSPFENLKDLIDYAKENPRKLTIGTAGVGTSTDIETLYFDVLAGVDVTVVPFEGDSGVRAALLGGHIMSATLNLTEITTHLQQNEMKVLGVMAEERLPNYPDIPTFKEQGIDMVFGSARGIIAPKGMPEEIADKLSTAIEEIVKSERFTKRAEEMKMPLVFMPLRKYEEFFLDQDSRVEKLMRAIGQIE